AGRARGGRAGGRRAARAPRPARRAAVGDGRSPSPPARSGPGLISDLRSPAMYTLGINAAYHDPAACLVKDGCVIAAAEEERFTHVKHGKRPVPFSAWELPFHAIAYCLREAGITWAEVDHLGYSYDPNLLLGRHRDA